MKHLIILAAVLAVTMCTSTAPVNTGQQAAQPTQNTSNNNQAAVNFCRGLAIDFISPQPNDRISGGFHIEWNLLNSGNESYVNKDVSFVIFMRPENGTLSELRNVNGIYGETLKRDITFLSKVSKGKYYVGLKSSMTSCTIPEAEVPVTVL